MRKLFVLALVVIMSIQLFSCSGLSKTTKGAAAGTATGGVIGAVIGKQAGNTALGAIIGAAIGGTAGAYIGKKMDNQAEEIKQDIAGAEVERVGEGIKITFKSALLFKTGEATLQSLAQADLEQLAVTLNKYSDTNILIEGHADSQGEEAYNQKLSEQRAHAVASYLGMQKVDPSRFTIMGYGEMQPVASNETPEGRQANRRVELAIMANDKLKKEAQTVTKS